MCQYFVLACRLFRDLWIPLVSDSFSTGAKVYNHLCAPTGKHLLHAAKNQPDMPRLPENNAQKRQLLDTLVTLIASNQHANVYAMLGPAAKPDPSASAHPAAAAEDRPGTPEAVDTLYNHLCAPPASVMLHRKLEFDGTGISPAKLMTVTWMATTGSYHLSASFLCLAMPWQSSSQFQAQGGRDSVPHARW